MRRLALGLTAAVAAICAACGPPSVRPATYADPSVACPGGRSAWVLEISDQRADRVASDRTTASIRDGIQKSFPGCRWTPAGTAGAETISIEIHRFSSHLEEYTSWEAAVEWSVRVVGANGSTLTEFQANEEVSRPNYRGTDNEKESLTEAYQKALQRTIKGLAALPSSGAERLPAGTPAASAPAVGAAGAAP
jgi:hypothetical protein